ncbi:hypothetical protein FSU_0076 [Fibrobacter succinogenes subsp. succinogenes S85]|uniref:Uncharacterized protein n=1 Tax=Fibrobacter succinogenes (strain ATCC 19169 / S85) TaxID=59374 RepID=D9S4E6_FIBSS|nr:hypothetical protein [Fibrobacter succinogenes]ADL24672.1 hypothetical protein FSU_0076 [Fibrobacter succinogenes subsp. succinogenes S85]
MSSKKTTSKAPAKASTSEKKSAKPAPAKKPAAKVAPAPAKKAASAKAPAKPAVAAKKPAAKAAPAPAKKAAPVKAAPAKPAPAKKPAAKKEEPAKKETTKVVKAAPAPAKKTAPEKKVEPAVEAKAVAKKTPEKEVEKKVVKEPVKEAEKAPEKAPEKVVEKLPKKLKSWKNLNRKKSTVKSDYPYAVLLEGGKKPCKFIMFVEIDEQEERANKKKVTSEMKNLEKKPTSAIRHKISLAEETQEELTERILKELEEQNAAFTREAATQICTRCNKNLVSPEFWVDKHLGYCEECAAILHLGQSKEARKVEYQLGAMGGDSLDEVEDDDIEGPDAADLKEAEEELADFDD